MKTKKRLWIPLLSSLTLLAAIASLWWFGHANTVSAAEDLKTITQSTTNPGLLGTGYLNHGGGPGFKGGDIDYGQLLADALGITVEELETATQTARDAALDQAVAQGLITEDQANQMKVWGGNRGGIRLGRGNKDVAEANTIDEQALLADALGITVEQLQAARETANQVAIAQAVEQGLITQEEADAMQARKAVKSYLDRDALLAKALGMTTEELQAAYAEGKTLTDLMTAKGLDAATVREKLQATYSEALAQAVTDGVITQEQADAMKSERRGFGLMPGGMPGNRGPGGRMGPDGHGGFRGRDGNGQHCPCAPDTDTNTDDNTTGSGWRAPNRTITEPGTDA
ncbi:MAG TPA: hypothetical protein PKH77_09305 [Anaerolineae bacterium]|nr:hypothetical protein [Anaerolineae bacterium]